MSGKITNLLSYIITLILLLSLFPLVEGETQQLYSNVTISYTVTGDIGWSINAADLDDDGNIDLIANSLGLFQNPDWVSVLYNRSNGTFIDETKYSTDRGTAQTCVLDFDKDGKLDMAVVNMVSQTISLLHNDGLRKFSLEINYNLGIHPLAICEIDIDGDTDYDIVTGNNSSENNHNIAIIVNDGTGQIDDIILYLRENPAMSIASDDFNGDGYSDLAIADLDTNHVSVYLNTGIGTLASPVKYVTNRMPYSIKAADIDGDIDIDLVVANTQTLTNNITLLFNDGSGNFDSTMHYTLDHSIIGLDVGDIDNNSSIDIVAAGNISGRISILLNNGQGLFQLHADKYLSKQSQLQYVILSDLNNDDFPEIVTIDEGGNGLQHLAILYNIINADFICGDINRDSEINLLDLLFAIDYLYNMGTLPYPPDASDVNADRSINLLDIMYLINFLYGSPNGPEPVCQ